MEEIKKQIEEAYKKAGEAGNEFSKCLMELRSIDYQVDPDNEEEVKEAFALGRDIDLRTAFLLRALLVQHGNVLFL
jgi:hypothetical protein